MSDTFPIGTKSAAEQEALTFVDEVLANHFGYAGRESATRQQLVQRIVNKVAELLRPVAEQQVRSSGWLRPDEARERSDRMANATLADYCRHKRLALEGAAIHVGDSTTVGKVMTVLAIDEAHYARLANRPTKAEEASLAQFHCGNKPQQGEGR